MLTETYPELTELQKLDRQNLHLLSINMQMLVMMGHAESINDALVKYYKGKIKQATGMEITFNTFHGWKANGKKVKKGEKGFTIWGRPINIDTEEKDNYKYFPIGHLFCDLQVEDANTEDNG